MDFKSPKGGTFQPTKGIPAQSPSFTPGANPGPIGPSDKVDQNMGGQIGLLNSEADVAGVEKKGI